MKIKILFIILISSQVQVFSQNFLTNLKSKSFGLNNHTNRDISYFTHVDSNENTIIIGTSEKDSTFTDIITTKLDPNYNTIWQKRLSIDTNLSYDVPVKTFMSQNNEIYIVGRSAFNSSNHNGLIFITKYDEYGNIVFNNTIGSNNGSDYVDYGYLDADLNDDGTLNLVYYPFNNQSSQSLYNFNFVKIDNQGNIINSFTQGLPDYHSIIGKIKNDKYYFLIAHFLDNYNLNISFKFYRIEKGNQISVTQINDPTFINYYQYSDFPGKVRLSIDDNENCYLTAQNEFNREKINLSKIDNTNTFNYSVNTPDLGNYYLINSFINNQNENVIVANNLNSNSIDFLNFDNNNSFQQLSSSNNILATGFKKNQDDSFFLTTSNSNIRLFSNNLLQLNSFNTSDTFELTDFAKIDNQSISTIGTTYDKMFSGSDFFTQLDIKSEKINDIKVTHDYSFSGIGTSKAFQQRIIVDNDGNYLVLVTEKMGPEYLGIGGTNPPLHKRIIKYDSNLNKIWESEVPDGIYNLVSHGGRDIYFFIDDSNNLYLNLPRAGNNYGLGYDLYKVNPDGIFEFINHTYVADNFHANESLIFMGKNYFTYSDSSKLYVLDKSNGNLINEIDIGHEEFLEIFSIGNDYYFYTFEEVSNNTPDYIYLYKNGSKIITRNLPDTYGISYEVDDNGTLFFTTQYLSDIRLNKLEINNTFNYYSFADNISKFKIFNNGNIFIHLDGINTIVLDNNLNFISNGDPIDSSNSYLVTWEDYILFSLNFRSKTHVINQNGDIINEISTKTPLHDWNFQIDQQGNLAMVSQFGNKINPYNEYSWSVGLIQKYESLHNFLNTEDFNENHGEDFIDVYPNPTSGIVNIYYQNVEKVLVYDITGKMLAEHKSNTIDINEFKKGIYILKIYTCSGKIFSSKVIKI